MEADTVLWQQADAVFDRLLELPDDVRDAALASLELSEALASCVRRLLCAHRVFGALDSSPLIAFSELPPDGER